MGKRLKELRKALGLSQGEFGRKIGRTLRAIQNYEAEQRVPDKTTLKLIEFLFNVNPEWLEKGKGKMFLETPTLVKTPTGEVIIIKHLSLEEVMENLAEKALMEILEKNMEELKGECLLKEELIQYAKRKLIANYEALKSELLLQIRIFRHLWKEKKGNETS